MIGGADPNPQAPLAQQMYGFTPSLQWPNPAYTTQPQLAQAYSQSIMLPHVSQTMTPQDPSWNMDTGASSHLVDNTGILTSFSNSSIYPSVFVGNGHSIPVTHTGHSFLHTSSKPLQLNHILITPHIIKNLISICKFTRDNDVSFEFDSYGFSIKDYQTQRILLRCDSTGDLYLVTQQPSFQTPVVLLSFSFTTWHRRLSHPGEDVLRRLDSSALLGPISIHVVTSKIVFWIDPEFRNGCYKNLIIELYLALNPDERYEYMEQIKVQEHLEILQVQYDFYQAQMKSKLNESENSATFWKKMVVVFVVLFFIVKLL
ncbi:hypothetical protein Tco_1346973 [Tanacetum coccineum]